MKSNQVDSVKRFLADAARNELLSIGRLMSPNEVLESITPENRDDRRVKGWFLCGDVHPDLFNKIKSGESVTWSLKVRHGEGSTPFLVVTQRAGDWEHRFLMPLAGETARSFYGEIGNTGVGISVATAEGSEALVERVYVASTNLDYAKIDIPLEPKDGIELALDFLEQTIVLLSKTALSAASDSARNICVTTIMPSDLRLQLESAAAQKHGELH